MRYSIGRIFSLTVLLLSGCDDFLNKEPQNEISKAEMLGDIYGLDVALTGAYTTLLATGYYGEFLMIYAEVTGGNAAINEEVSTSSAERTQFERVRDFSVIADNDDVTHNTYPSLYRAIYQVNSIIEAISENPDLPAAKDQILGEALCIRALAHFDLLRLFALPYNYTDDASHPGVVLLERPLEPAERPARSTVRAGYDLVVSDLERAIPLLTSSGDRYRFTALAAKALLAKVLLYREEWSRVVALANEVISGDVTLATNGQYNAIWANGYIGNEYLLRLRLSHLVSTTLSGLWGPGPRPVLRASQDLIGLHAPGDVRASLIVLNSSGLAVTLKYPFSNNIANDVPVLRLSEVYLMRAEAYAELERPQLASIDLNTVRKRANPAAEELNLAGEALMNEILLERRRELAFEGNLLFDLTRKKRDVVRTDCPPSSPCVVTYPNTKTVLPIPRAALFANPELVQNDGY